MRFARSGHPTSGDMFGGPQPAKPRAARRAPGGVPRNDAERVQKWLCENPPATPPKDHCGQCLKRIDDYARAAPFLHHDGKLWLHRKCIASFTWDRDQAARAALGIG